MTVAIITFCYLVGLTALLHAILLISKKSAEVFRVVPCLDLWIAAYVYAPPIVTAVVYSWTEVLICIAVQTLFLALYSAMHSLSYRIRKGQKGGRLLSSLSKGLSRPRVILGFYITLLAIPVFVVLRVGQLTVYPLLQWSVDYPSYKHSDWIQLSRHKFEGLIGLDLLWCLYCEWAAGVYALGGEMVRNNESFWCPIRFYSQKHCENCEMTFPDLKEWVEPTGSIEQVQELLEKKYPKNQRPKSWYAHSSRTNSN